MNSPSVTAASGKGPAIRRSKLRTRSAAVVACAAMAATGLSMVPASGTIGEAGVRPGKSITVFHNIDFVAVFGYGPIGRQVTVSVVRNGVTIGSASGRSVSTPEGPGLEVNHGPEGAPVPGDCWEGHTPDIKPGDHIFVTDGVGTDEVVVDDIRFTGDPGEETPGGDILVPFTAIDANGAPIPIARLDSAEFRAGSRVRFEATDIIVEAAASGVPGEYVMRYPSPFLPSRNRDLLNEAQLRALLLEDGHAIGFGHVAPPPAEAMLVDGLADAPGPAPGCESAVSASSGVAGVTPSVINGRTPAGTALRVEGFSDSATDVEVGLSDADGTSVSTAAVIEGTGLQTWSADFTAEQLADLDGNIRVVAIVDGVESLLSKTVIKDTVAPEGPTTSLPAGTYRRTQRVALAAGPSDQIRYTLGNRVAAPTANRGRLYRGGQLRIASTQTLKMIAVDEAGNVSRLVRQRYRILNAPSRPEIRRASRGDRGGRTTAVARWAPPASANGSRVTGYRVMALELRPNGSVASRKRSRTLRPRARSTQMRLSAGRYQFQVRAINAIGAGSWSARSNTVRAR